MTIFNFLELFGGIAFFLFGMLTMEDELTSLAGGNFESLLARFCSSRIKGILLGALITILVQSSTAVTVMVVALVNSGVMSLDQAVTIIMGANIGTTMTPWILSLAGLSSDNPWIQLLNPSSFAPIMAVIGIVFIILAKTKSKKATGRALLGFSILMFGMQAMTASVSGLSNDPNFVKLFAVFNNPFVGIIAGMLLTAIVQSSAASVGILQALSTTNAVTFGSALPIIMGQNIGTCLTALLASIGSQRHAKQASMIHLLFNVIGTTVFIIGFYVINALVHFPFMNDPVTPVNIAIFHTVFNVITTLLLLPFAHKLVQLSQLLVPSKSNPEEFTESAELAEQEKILHLLEPNLLNHPALAADNAQKVLIKMTEASIRSVDTSFQLLSNWSEDHFKQVETLENVVDNYEDALSDYLVKISGQNLSDRENRLLTLMLHAVNDVERISDHAIQIAEQARKKSEADSFSPRGLVELNYYCSVVDAILQKTLESLKSLSTDLAFQIEPLEDWLDEINHIMTSRHYDRLTSGTCTIENGLIITEIYNNLERIADHCSNVGIYVIQYPRDQYKQHEYTAGLDKSSARYQELYQADQKIYPLPDALTLEVSGRAVSQKAKSELRLFKQ